MKRVLVTGGSGFIGQHALPYLVEKGYEVHCVTSGAPRKESAVQWHRADLFSESECREIFRSVKPSHLLHFAWYTEPGKYWTSEKNLEWVRASLDILKNFKASGGTRATFAGTCAEYDRNFGFCSEGITPCVPDTLYGTCKNSLRQMASSYSELNHVSFSWGRIFFLYGPGEHPSRLVSSVIRSLLRNEEAKCTHGDQIRDFLHAEDVASAFAALLDCNVEGPVNIASGEPVSLKTVINGIGVKIGNPARISFGAIPVPANDPPVILADTRRLNKEVGWKQKYSLDAGLDDVIEWWKHHL
ncbi:MAG TPA: NAD(P)-dependent oxidoreductase [Methanocella sp.]|jgi:nucleoside-diphosphate-sugar epimerase